MSDFEIEVKGDKFVAPDAGVPGPSIRTERQSSSAQPQLSEQEIVEIEETEKAEKAERSSLLSTLEALNNDAKVRAQEARLLTDPNIREYLEARSRGEDVQIGPRVVEKVVDEKLDLETLTNTQLVDHLNKLIGQSVGSLVDSKLKDFGSKLTPVLQNLEAHTKSQQSQEINSQISRVKEKYTDFDQLKPKMAEINQSVQGLTVEELYHLTKARLGGSATVTREKLETERPTVPSGRRGRENPGSYRGRSGFSGLLDEALK